MLNDTLDKLSTQFKTEIESIYQNFNNSFLDDSPLNTISKYQMFSGGKRIRPILIFTIANIFSNKINKLTLNLATAVELLHNATLIHDDIIDDSNFRRFKATVKKEYGSSKAILSGDYLFAYAFDYIIDLPKRLIIETQKTTIKLIKGEFEELGINLKQASINDSLNIMENKTSSLFSLCTSGAYLLNTPKDSFDEALFEKFKEFGKLVGTCFQIADDILDVSVNTNVTGKKQFTDIIEKKPSIIVTLWLSKKTPLLNKYLTGQIDEKMLKAIDSELKEYNIKNDACAIFKKYYDKAHSIIVDIPQNYTLSYPHNLLKLNGILQWISSNIDI